VPAIKSVLKGIIEAFPEKQTIKGTGITPMLKKKGVNADELKYADLAIDNSKRYTKADLKALEAGRKDTVETVEQKRTGFDWVSLHDDAVNPTYKEKITTFKQAGQEEKEVASKIPAQDMITLNQWLDEGAEASDDLVSEADTIARRYGLSTDAEDYEAVANLVDRGELVNHSASRYTSEHLP